MRAGASGRADGQADSGRHPAAQRGLPPALLGAVVLHAALAALWLGGGGGSGSPFGPRQPVLLARVIEQTGPSSEAQVESTRSDTGSTAGMEAGSTPSRSDLPSAAEQTPSGTRPLDSRPAVPPAGGASVARAASAAAPASAPPSPDAKVRQAQLEAALPPAPDYLPGVSLDRSPTPLDEVVLEYPEEGNLREGTVVLRILISETGQIDDVSVVRSFPKVVFDKAAITAFAAVRFAPGLRAGAPTKSQLTIEVHFAPYNRGGRVSGRGY